MAAILALCSAATFGVADFAGGLATRRLNVFTVTLISNIVGALFAVLLVAIFGGALSVGALGWGAAAGVVGVIGLVMLYSGLAIGPAHLVSPVSGVLAALVPVTVGIASGERPGVWVAIGLVLTFPAIWLVAGGGATLAARPTALLLGTGSGLGFGVFFVLLANAPTDAGAVPLVAARIGSTTVLAAIVLARGVDRTGVDQPRLLALPAATGALDMAANGLFLWASRSGDLAVVGALTSLYPVSTVVLSLVAFGERLTRSQLVGVVMAAAAAAMLSAR